MNLDGDDLKAVLQSAPASVPKRVALVSPGSLKGFMSARAAMALPEATVSESNDIRLDDGTARVRPGSTLLNSAINGTQTFRGCFECVQNGTPSIFVATSNGTTVSILRSTDGGATFAEVTSAPTRLSEGFVYFAIASQASVDYVILQNDIDAPRHYDGSSVRTVPTVNSANYSVKVSYDLGTGTVFASNPTVSVVNSGDFDGAVRTVGNGSYLWLHADPGHINSTGEYVTVGPLTDPIVLPAMPTSGPTPQIAMFLDAGAAATSTTDASKTVTSVAYDASNPDERWRSMLIEGSTNGTAWFNLYDPTSSSLVAIPGDGNTYLAAWPIVAANAGRTVNYLRFSYPVHFGTTKDGDVFLMVYTIRNAGLTPGGTSYAAAFGQPGATVATDGPTRSGGIVASGATGAQYGGVSLPVSTAIGYRYTVTTTGPSGPAYVYRDDLGSSGYYLLSSFNGPGSFADPGTGYVDFTQGLPDASALPIPIGTGMATVNGRLFVCAGNRLYYSESDRPFTFSRNVRFDSDGQAIASSAGSLGKSGETFQTVVGIGMVPTGAEADGTPQTGSVALYALTDRTTYVISGWDALSLNKTTPICVGTRSPFSIAKGQSGGFRFLDAQGQIRVVDGTESKAVSKYRVDDRLKGIPASRLARAWGATVDERYYLAFTPSGSTSNTNALVLNDELGWESLDRPYLSAQGFLPYFDPSLGRTRLLAFSDTQLFEHAAYGATLEGNGSGVSARIVFPEVEMDGMAVMFGRAFFVADPDPTGTVTLSVLCSTGYDAPSVAYAAVSLAARSTGETRVGARADVNVGGLSLTVQPILSLSAKGGTRLYRLDLDLYAGSDAVVA